MGGFFAGCIAHGKLSTGWMVIICAGYTVLKESVQLWSTLRLYSWCNSIKSIIDVNRERISTIGEANTCSDEFTLIDVDHYNMWLNSTQT